MEDQELWDLMGDLEDVGLGDSQTKAYLIAGFYEDWEEHLDNESLTVNLVKSFIEDNKADGVDLFYDSLMEPKSPHVDPLISSWFVFADKYLIIKGNFTKVRSVEERLRKDFVIEKEVELKNYKKFESRGISGSVGATGILGTSGTNGSSGSSGTSGTNGSSGSSGTTTVVYSTSGMGGSWSTSGVTVSISTPKMIQTSVKIEMPIRELKYPPEDEIETYGHPLWEKIKGKLGF
jgi:hypothetical protein